MKKSLLFSASIIVLGIVIAFFYFNRSISGQTPNISVKTITGESISLISLKGKPALITFWSTDCSGCIKEIPHLKELYRDYHHKGLTIIAISMHYDRLDHILSMVEAKKIPYTVAFDNNATAADAFGNVRLTPTSFLINSNGNIVMQKVGEFDLPIIHKKIQQLLEAS